MSASFPASARFFAEKFRASVWVELFILSKVSLLVDRAEAHLERAHLAWAGVADIARDVYHDDLTFGPQTWLRGSWQKRLQEIEIERVDLQAMRCDPPHETVHPDTAMQRVIHAVDGRRPTASGGFAIEAAETFEAGKAFEVKASATEDAALVLHYRHVNQAERWASTPMTRRGDAHIGIIPAGYTHSPFHLQFYVTTVGAGGVALAPGLCENLSNEPYKVALQA